MKHDFLPFGPFIFSQPTIKTKHLIISILLFLQITLMIFEKDYMAIVNIIMSILSVFVADIIYRKLNKETIKLDITILTTGIVIGFCFPSTYNVIYLGCIVFISFFISKLLFGGNGSNWINPIVTTVCIAYISSAHLFPDNLNIIESITNTGSLFSSLQVSGFEKIRNDQYITSLLNSAFQNLGVIIPDGYVTLITKYSSSIPAFRYNLLTIVASIIMMSLKIIDSIIPKVFLLTYGLLVWLFSMFPINGSFGTGDIIVAWCTSGTLFYAFFVLTDTASTPNTLIGKSIFAIVTAIFAFLVCGPGASAVGIAFSILLGNIFVPLINYIENRVSVYKFRSHYER
ncbi:MAG: hypothetical protein CR988_06855 [Treponema sp.]|nr:MAG: hypothetical protein CR988_06855 [Treponema sp.]